MKNKPLIAIFSATFIYGSVLVQHGQLIACVTIFAALYIFKYYGFLKHE